MNVRLASRLILVPLAVLGLTPATFAIRAGGGQAAAPAPAPAVVIPPEEEKRFADAWEQQPRVDLGVPAGTARVVVVKFNDWLCGGCKAMHEAYQPLFDKYEKEMPGAIKYVVKDWPWNNHCNFSLGQSLGGHEASCEAAVAVRLARDRGKEREMVAWLFSEQTRLIGLRTSAGAAATAIVVKATELLGLKPGDFERDYPLRLQTVRQDVADGVAAHIDVTPTYFVNGIKTTAPVNPADGTGGYNLPPEYFDLGLRLELRKTGGK